MFTKKKRPLVADWKLLCKRCKRPMRIVEVRVENDPTYKTLPLYYCQVPTCREVGIMTRVGLREKVDPMSAMEATASRT